MSKPKTYDPTEIIEAEKTKVSPLQISVGDRTITLLPPILWPDKVYRVDDDTAMQIILGDGYDAFVEAGGTTRLLFQKIVPDWQQANSEPEVA